MKNKIFLSVIIAGLIYQYCMSNPLPDKVIVYIRAFPPEIGLWSAEQVDISGDSIITSNSIAIIDSGVIIPENYFGDPFILDSSNTSGFIINPESDSVYVTLEYIDGPVKFGNWGIAPPPIKDHYLDYDNFYPDHWDSMPYLVFSFDFSIPDMGWTDVVINEINSHCTWGNEANFIELYNKSDTSISLDGWHLVCDTIYDFPSDSRIPANGFYVVDEDDFPDNFDMDFEADNIYLINPTPIWIYNDPRRVDQVGWSSDHGENVSFMRYPDGDADSSYSMADFQGYNDETSSTFENGFPTRGAPNRHECPDFVVISARADSTGAGTVNIYWTDPIWELDFELSVLVKSTDGYPQTPFDGEIIYQSIDQQFLGDYVPPNEMTYYTIFARNNDGEYSTPTDESRTSIILGGVGVDGKELPEGYTFLTCYPNPFNAHTTISFSLEKESYVKISIYDITGRLVDILVERHFRAGENSVIWNADDLSSGVYFYSIKTEQNTLTQKAVLLK